MHLQIREYLCHPGESHSTMLTRNCITVTSMLVLGTMASEGIPILGVPLGLRQDWSQRAVSGNGLPQPRGRAALGMVVAKRVPDDVEDIATAEDYQSELNMIRGKNCPPMGPCKRKKLRIPRYQMRCP